MFTNYERTNSGWGHHALVKHVFIERVKDGIVPMKYSDLISCWFSNAHYSYGPCLFYDSNFRQ